jgi:hypothetical protein
LIASASARMPGCESSLVRVRRLSRRRKLLRRRMNGSASKPLAYRRLTLKTLIYVIDCQG